MTLIEWLLLVFAFAFICVLVWTAGEFDHHEGKEEEDADER